MAGLGAPGLEITRDVGIVPHHQDPGTWWDSFDRAPGKQKRNGTALAASIYHARAAGVAIPVSKRRFHGLIAVAIQRISSTGLPVLHVP